MRSEGGTVREALRCGDVNTVRNIPETNSDTVEDEDADVAQERRNVELLEQGSGNTQVGRYSTFCVDLLYLLGYILYSFTSLARLM